MVGRALEAIKLLRALDDQHEVQAVWGAEQELSVSLPDGPTIRFRVDRLERVQGRPMLTDFKLGKPRTVAKTEGTRRKHILEAVRRGELLQGALYARAVEDGSGRYVYLNPSKDFPQRVFQMSADDEELQGHMEAAVGELEEVMRQGSMFPRLVTSKGENQKACDFCSVREACLRDDSTLRRQLLEAVEAEPESPASRARRALWVGGASDE